MDHLLFDTTDIDTIEDTHSVGAYVRSGKSGALVTHHSALKGVPTGFSFVDADVTPGSDTIAETAHGLFTGDKVQLTTTGVLPAGLALTTDYYVIRVDANTIKLASSAYNAEWNFPVDITAAAGGGTHTVVGQNQDVRALDVWLMNPSIQVTQGTSPWVVQAGAEKDEDSAHASGHTGNFVLAVRRDADTTMVDADGDYAPLQVDENGRLKVVCDIEVANGHEKLEDAAHSSGDVGSYVLAVRQDVLSASVDADGDYGSFKIDSLGRLYVTDASLANTAIAAAAETLDVAGTSQNIIVSPLANRKYLFVYNKDNQTMYVGQAGITVGSGYPVSPGSEIEMRAGAAVDVEFVSAKLNHEIRTLELS